MSDEKTVPAVVEVWHVPCQNCGRLMTLQKDSKQVYCSPECSQEFSTCPVCGRFFPSDQAMQGTCSAACAEVHPEYDHIFKEFE